jgi:hypothetical protein
MYRLGVPANWYALQTFRFQIGRRSSAEASGKAAIHGSECFDWSITGCLNLKFIIHILFNRMGVNRLILHNTRQHLSKSGKKRVHVTPFIPQPLPVKSLQIS